MKLQKPVVYVSLYMKVCGFDASFSALNLSKLKKSREFAMSGTDPS